MQAEPMQLIGDADLGIEPAAEPSAHEQFECTLPMVISASGPARPPGRRE
jgi:hypothetical protein